ncbi:DUF167 domain-containing protein [Hyphomonas sp.]|uniref:DUF167 domain-containing protein n=1 Tax=Hyphomonas sp. TaxID=87 RepID=UPI0025C04A26|nr:DUF167 domain-containing protein [Hyphomonas sp.]
MRHRLAVRVQPGASADRIEGRGQDEAGRLFLKVRVRARPADGAANAAVEMTVAKALGLGKSAVRVVTGDKNRLKGLEIEGPPELAGVIEGWLADERKAD